MVLHRLQQPGTATALASAMGVSEATISRIKNERLEECLLLLAHLEIKCVPSSHHCVDERTFEAFELLWLRAMRTTSPRKLIFSDDIE